MRLKEDHMRNEQLKPAYNLQIGVSDEYIINLMISQDRNDMNTFIPFLESFKNEYNYYPKYVENFPSVYFLYISSKHILTP